MFKQSEENRLKRANMTVKVFELKINQSHLNSKEKEFFNRLFLEAKWLYNQMISSNDIFKFDTKVKEVEVKTPNGIEVRPLSVLPAQVKQEIKKEAETSIKVLSTRKKRGYKIGRLKFKKECNSIGLKQPGVSHKIVGNKFKITGIKRPLRVFGLKQIKDTFDIANAKIVRTSLGLFIKLTCYVPIQEKQPTKYAVGIDLGIKDSVVTSDGEKFNIRIGESESLKRASRKFNKAKKGSNNRIQKLKKLKREYEKISNLKKDKTNKIVSHLTSTYEYVVIQDELIKLWHKGLFGKQVQHSSLGSIKAKLKANGAIVVPSSEPTTKVCYECGSYNYPKLNDRVYVCECGLREDRDIKAAKTIMYIGLSKNKIPMERRNSKSVEKMLDLEGSKAIFCESGSQCL